MSAFEEVATVDVNAGAGAKASLMDNQKVPGSGLGPLPSCASNSIATECDDRDDVAVEDVEANEDSVARVESDAGDIAADTPDTNDNANGTREHRQGCVSQFFSTIGLGCRQMTSDAVSCATCKSYELVEPEEVQKKAISAPATEWDNLSVRDSRTASLPIALSQSMSIDISTFLEDASNAGTDLFSQEEPTSSSVCQFFGMFSCAPHQNEEESEVSEEKERINNIDEADSVSEGGDTLITTDDLSKGDRKPDEDSDVLITTDDLNMGDGKSDGSQGKKSKEMDIDQQRQSSAFDPVGHLLLNQYGSCESSLTQTLGEDSVPAVFRSSSRDAKAKSVGIKKKLAKKLLPKRLRSSRPASAAKQRSVLDSVPEAFMSVPESAPESAVLAAIKSAPESVQREYYDAVSKTAVIAA